MSIFKSEFEYFSKLCEIKNFSHAAEIIGIQQSGLSKAIKKIEESYGKKLFIRKGRELILTEFGKALQNQLLEMKTHWDEGFHNKLEQLQSVSGLIKLGAHPTIAINSLRTHYPYLCEKYPHLTLQLIFERSPEVCRKVIDCELDFGIVVNPPKHPDLVLQKINQEYVGIWQRQQKGRKKEKDKQKNYLYYNPEMINIVHLRKDLQKYKHISVADYEVMAHFAQNSEGLFLLPGPVGKRYGLELVKKLVPADLYLIYRFDRAKTVTFCEVRDTLLN